MIKLLHRLEESLIGVLLVAVTLLVFLQVVLRFGFDTSIHWAQEVTLLLNAWFVLLGASWALREKAHIAVNAFVKNLPTQARVVTTSLAILISLVYVGLFGYGAYIYLGKMKLIGLELEDLAFPKWIAMSVLMIGFVLIGFRLLVMLWRVIRYQEVEQFHENHELPSPSSEEAN